MKISCFKNDLKEAVFICDKISGKNLNLPILSNILLEVDDSGLKIISTNLDLGVEIVIPVKIENNGKITVPSGILSGYLSNVSGGEKITLEVKNNNLIVSTENNSTLIKSQNADDFPSIPKLKTENSFSMPVIDLISSLKMVFYSCSLSNIKPEISSVYLYSSKADMLTFTATDSFRLAEKKNNYFFDNLGPVLIPFKTVVEVIRIFDGKDGNIEIVFNKNQINFKKDNIIFVSRLIDGIFPDYNQIIPKKFSANIIVKKDEIINSLKLSSVFLGKLNEVLISANLSDDFFTIKTANNDSGESVTKIPAKITGENVNISFNHKYIYDCLLNMNSENIVFKFSGEGKPLLITSENDNTFQYLVMPMSM